MVDRHDSAGFCVRGVGAGGCRRLVGRIARVDRERERDALRTERNRAILRADGLTQPLGHLRAAQRAGEEAEDDAEEHGIHLEVVKLPEAKRGFVLLPRRWVVERTFAWISRCRRNAKDYERKPEHGEAMIHLTMIALMSKRLADQQS